MGLIQTIIVVFGVIAIAYAAAHFKLLDERVGDGLSDFVFMIAAPLLLFRTMVTADFHGTAPWQLWIAYFIGVIVAWAASDLAIKLFFGRDNRAGVVAGVSGAFSNLVFLGMPLMLGVFGQEGFAILSLIVAVHMPIMMAASITLHEIAMSRDGVFKGEELLVRSAGRSSKACCVIPLCLASSPAGHGVCWVCRMPNRSRRLIETLSESCRTRRVVRHGHGSEEVWHFWQYCSIAGHVCYQACCHACRGLGRRMVDRLAAIYRENCGGCGGVPAGVNSYLIATRFGTGQALASNSMVMATALSAITMAFWISVVTHIFG